MIELQKDRYYKLTYYNGSEVVFQVIEPSPAKHLIQIRTSLRQRLSFIELLSERWIDLCEVVPEFGESILSRG